MTLTRTLAVLSLTLASLVAASPAHADTLQDVFRTIRQLQVNVGGVGAPNFRPPIQPGYRPGPVAPPNFGTCPPPPPPVHCIYCVYYLDCYGHWKLFGEFRSKWQADSARHRLQNQGYRTYVRVKRVRGTFPGGGLPGGGFPGVPTGPVLFNR